MQRSIVMLGAVLVMFSSAQAQPSVWNKLIARAKMEHERLITRGVALAMACNMADTAGAAELVSMASDWADQIDEAGISEAELAPDSELSARREPIPTLVCNGGSRLNAVSEPAATLDLWTEVATRPWIGQEVKETAFQLIAANPCPYQMRQAAALAALRDSGVGRAGQLPQSFESLMDESAVPALRALVSESDAPESFNFTAAAVLAEAGDTAILPNLQPQQDPFDFADAREGGTLAWYAWQIQVQNPPTQLLGHIASGELFIWQSRCWAIRRAVELGLPAAKIRQAILAYAAVGRPFGPLRLAAGIANMKAVGLELEVLWPSDLPDVGEEAAEPQDDVRQSPAWQVATPAVEWQPPWEPRYENFEVFFEWMQSQDWRSLTEEEDAPLFRQRLCELELIPPAFCPSPPPPSETEEPPLP